MVFVNFGAMKAKKSNRPVTFALSFVYVSLSERVPRLKRVHDVLGDGVSL